VTTGPDPQQPPPDPHRPAGQTPPPGSYPPGQPGYPMVRPLRPDEEKLWAVAAHLGPLLLGFLAPLVVWLVFKDRSQYLDRTGKEALNMQISYMLYGLVAGISIILLVGLLLLPAVGLAWLVLMIVATVKVANHEEFRYPAIIRFVS
jgi:uncharacterized Tic20 family protein